MTRVDAQDLANCRFCTICHGVFGKVLPNLYAILVRLSEVLGLGPNQLVWLVNEICS